MPNNFSQMREHQFSREYSELIKLKDIPLMIIFHWPNGLCTNPSICEAVLAFIPAVHSSSSPPVILSYPSPSVLAFISHHEQMPCHRTKCQNLHQFSTMSHLPGFSYVIFIFCYTLAGESMSWTRIFPKLHILYNFWLTDWLTDQPSHWLVGWLANYFTDWLASWLADWPHGQVTPQSRPLVYCLFQGDTLGLFIVNTPWLMPIIQPHSLMYCSLSWDYSDNTQNPVIPPF